MLAASAVTVMVSVPLPRVSVNLPASRVSLAAIDGGGLFRTGKLNACRFRRHRDGLRPASESEREFTGIAGFVGREGDRVLRVAFKSRSLDGHGIGVRRQIQETEQPRAIGRGHAGG